MSGENSNAGEVEYAQKEEDALFLQGAQPPVKSPQQAEAVEAPVAPVEEAPPVEQKARAEVAPHTTRDTSPPKHAGQPRRPAYERDSQGAARNDAAAKRTAAVRTERLAREAAADKFADQEPEEHERVFHADKVSPAHAEAHTNAAELREQLSQLLPNDVDERVDEADVEDEGDENTDEDTIILDVRTMTTTRPSEDGYFVRRSLRKAQEYDLEDMFADFDETAAATLGHIPREGAVRLDDVVLTSRRKAKKAQLGRFPAGEPLPENMFSPSPPHAEPEEEEEEEEEAAEESPFDMDAESPPTPPDKKAKQPPRKRRKKNEDDDSWSKASAPEEEEDDDEESEDFEESSERETRKRRRVVKPKPKPQQKRRGPAQSSHKGSRHGGGGGGGGYNAPLPKPKQGYSQYPQGQRKGGAPGGSGQMPRMGGPPMPGMPYGGYPPMYDPRMMGRMDQYGQMRQVPPSAIMPPQGGRGGGGGGGGAPQGGGSSRSKAPAEGQRKSGRARKETSYKQDSEEWSGEEDSEEKPKKKARKKAAAPPAKASKPSAKPAGQGRPHGGEGAGGGYGGGYPPRPSATVDPRMIYGGAAAPMPGAGQWAGYDQYGQQAAYMNPQQMDGSYYDPKRRPMQPEGDDGGFPMHAAAYQQQQRGGAVPRQQAPGGRPGAGAPDPKYAQSLMRQQTAMGSHPSVQPSEEQRLNREKVMREARENDLLRQHQHDQQQDKLRQMAALQQQKLMQAQAGQHGAGMDAQRAAYMQQQQAVIARQRQAAAAAAAAGPKGDAESGESFESEDKAKPGMPGAPTTAQQQQQQQAMLLQQQYLHQYAAMQQRSAQGAWPGAGGGGVGVNPAALGGGPS